MRIFEEFPSEILILIAKNVSDLASLHDLRLASPVFGAHLSDAAIGAEIVTEVARSMCHDNQKVFFHIWKLIQPSAPTWPLPSARNTAKRRFQNSVPMPTAESTLRVLALAKVIHDTAHRSLHGLLRRLVSLRPQRPVDIYIDVRRNRIWKRGPFVSPPRPCSRLPPMDFEAAGAPFELIEIEKALNGAWHLGLLAVLRELQIRDITNYLQSLSEHEGCAVRGMGTVQTLLDRDDGLNDARTRLAEVFASEPQCREVNCSVASRSYGSNGGLDELHPLSRMAHIMIHSNRYHYGPLYLVPVQYFLALGLEFWVESRVAAMGLLASDDVQRLVGIRLAEYGDMYTWKSVLSPKQLKELEDIQRSAGENPTAPRPRSLSDGSDESL